MAFPICYHEWFVDSAIIFKSGSMSRLRYRSCLECGKEGIAHPDHGMAHIADPCVKEWLRQEKAYWLNEGVVGEIEKIMTDEDRGADKLLKEVFGEGPQPPRPDGKQEP